MVYDEKFPLIQLHQPLPIFQQSKTEAAIENMGSRSCRYSAQWYTMDWEKWLPIDE